jgi:hypothetical protein
MGDFCLKFDGTGYVDTGSAFNTVMKDSFSVNLWCRPSDGIKALPQWIMTNAAGTGNYCEIAINADTGGLMAEYASNNQAVDIVESGAVFTDGIQEWTMLTIVITKVSDILANLDLYVNGVLKATSGNHSCVMADFNAGMNMKLATYGSSLYYEGLLDDYRIYPKALSLSEIQAIYNSGIGTKYTAAAAQGGAASYAINCDEGFGQIVTDAVNALVGSLYGGAGFLDGGTPIDADDPIVELIAENIESAINAVTIANGYHQTLTALRPRRNDFSDVAPNDLTVLIKQADEEQGMNPLETQDWQQPFLLMAFVIDSDTATASIDTRINQVRADIQKKLLLDATRGGYAYDTVILPSQEFDDGNGFSGIAVKIAVKYRTNYMNPYAKA